MFVTFVPTFGHDGHVNKKNVCSPTSLFIHTTLHFFIKIIKHPSDIYIYDTKGGHINL